MDTSYRSEPLSNHSSLHSFEEEYKSLTETAIIVASFAPAIISDIACVPFGYGLTALAYLGYNFNPTEIKNGIAPILLLHGSGLNESEFVVARYFLDNPNYGSIFSFNMEGLITKDHEKGIDDYAKGSVRSKIKEIATLTECNKVITIGHSMGGVIATFYAENFSEEDGIEMKHVFTVASPIKGSDTLDFIWSKISENIKDTKRNQQMSPSGGRDHKGFSAKLYRQTCASEQEGKRNYYSIYSEADWIVPFSSGKVTESCDRILEYNYVGHWGIVAIPTTWYWVASKLDIIYSS